MFLSSNMFLEYPNEFTSELESKKINEDDISPDSKR